MTQWGVNASGKKKKVTPRKSIKYQVRARQQ